MPVYQYAGVDRKGKKVSGIIDADGEKGARVKLRRQGVFPMSIVAEGAGKPKVGFASDINISQYFQRVKAQDVAMMTRQMATLVGANIPLVDALAALKDQVENPKLRSIISQVREKVTEGTKLSDALKAHPKIFSNLYVNMVNAGENSGALGPVLTRLADFTEGQTQLRSKVIGAMIYPALMSSVGGVLMIALLTFVVPKVAKIFDDVNAVLPLPTRLLLIVSGALSNYWYLFIIIVPVIVWAFKRYLKTPKGIAWWDRFLLKMPLFGKLNRMVVISRFTRTLSTLISSGVPLLSAMGIVKNIITNSVLRKVVEETVENVREGQSLAEPLKRSGEFPPIVTHMIAIGEKTGDLETMLSRVADAYDIQVDNTVSTLTTLLEPIMILVMAVVVGFIVMSILLPILQLNQLGV